MIDGKVAVAVVGCGGMAAATRWPLPLAAARPFG